MKSNDRNETGGRRRNGLQGELENLGDNGYAHGTGFTGICTCENKLNCML